MAYKMKGSPMARNFGVGSPLHQDKKKKKTKEEMSNKEVTDAVKRNLKKKPENMQELLVAKDSVNVMTNEMKKRFEAGTY